MSMNEGYRQANFDVPEDIVQKFQFVELRPGVWYSTHQAEGALPNGAVVQKTNSEYGDGTPEDTLGKVVGSIPVPAEVVEMARHAGKDVRFFYFVEWDNNPGTPIGTLSHKVRDAR